MTSDFNLTVTRREKRQGMKFCSGLRTNCDSTRPDQFHAWKSARKLDPMVGSLCLQFLRHATWMTLLFLVISMLFTGESNHVFPLLLSRFKRIEIIIKIKANFYKEIAQFTILIAIIGNKISKYFFLTSLSQILYISTRQTYTSGKFNSRDSAWYNLFSFSDTSRSQIIAKESVARTIELSWQNTSELANLLPVRSSVVIDRTKSGL